MADAVIPDALAFELAELWGTQDVPAVKRTIVVGVVVGTILLGLVAIAIGWIIPRIFLAGSRRSQVLIVGINGSGKTSLFSLLKHGKIMETRSSMVENEGAFTIHSNCLKQVSEPLQKRALSAAGTVTLVDLPGHDKLRLRVLEKLPQAKRVVVMLDASTIFQKQRPVAELLTDILVERSISRDAVPVLVVCNKQDDLMAQPAAKVKELLASEMDRIRSTRAAGVDRQDGDAGGSPDEFLGVEGEPFTFDQISNEVEFVELSLLAVAHHMGASGGSGGDANGGGVADAGGVSDDDEEATAASFERLVSFVLAVPKKK
ncbi:signal recognition particle receptor beta subunit-domain-containing protein [Zopfochytrium polystomum]|nr:signal recognition particle receptor beta subunit-domain-containing protein [Zopfochytrium polystomum]